MRTDFDKGKVVGLTYARDADPALAQAGIDDMSLEEAVLAMSRSDKCREVGRFFEVAGYSEMVLGVVKGLRLVEL